jgi:hypothetical protein
MPILGTVASQFSGKSFNSFESIATVTVGGGGSANVEFSSIPATYTHLQVRGIMRSDGTLDGFNTQFNSDTGSNYARHRLYGGGSTVAADASASRTNITLADGVLTSASASIFGAVVFDIVDYANTNKYKTVKSLGGNDKNDSGTIWFNSGMWMNTNAITSVKIFPGDGNWVQYTQFALYGIKGS